MEPRIVSCPAGNLPSGSRRTRSVGFALAALVALLSWGTPSTAARTESNKAVILLKRISVALDGWGSTTTQHYTANGKLNGADLTGTFQIWEDGDRSREDYQLGPLVSHALRLGDRYFEQDGNGDVRELTGPRLEHERTSLFIQSGKFLHEPQRSRFLGTRERDGIVYDLLQIQAPGGDAETLEIDDRTARPTHIMWLANDGLTMLNLGDWHQVGAGHLPFRTESEYGDSGHGFTQDVQTLQTTTIPDSIFAPLVGRKTPLEHPVRIPITFRDNHIFTDVQIAGRVFHFLVDSGASSIVIDSDVAKSVGLSEEGDFVVSGAGNVDGYKLAHLPELRVGGVRMQDLVVGTYPLDDFDSMDGILGYPFFASSVVQIDVAHQSMLVYAPGTRVPEGDRFAMIADRRIPEVKFLMNESVEAPFVVDTGNAGDLLLFRPFVNAHAGLVAAGTETALSAGLGGVMESSLTKLDALSLGKTTLYDVKTELMQVNSGAFADQYDAGNVGMGVLKNFVVTIDFPESALYLNPSVPSPH
ncbi:MAG TPA: aspartyl protease family protein [Candidatus Baltobacteraceae bacterium]|jgi:hypothetical protein|nr:aspartyl protease family protein [Candidatus Baltobacteraceae bacterium]